MSRRSGCARSLPWKIAIVSASSMLRLSDKLINVVREEIVRKSALAAVSAAGFVFGNPLPGLAQDVLTTHGLSAALAAEAVSEAVAACAKQGYKVTAAIVDSDGVTAAMARRW
jgi:hypothetical protein